MGTDRHNAMTRELIVKTGNVSTDYAELMVILESYAFGCMMLNVQLFNCTPQVATALVESALQRAIERFTDENNKPR